MHRLKLLPVEAPRALIAVVALIAVALPVTVAAAPQATALVCGSQPSSSAFMEPPDVVASRLPVNAGGEHELILAVHWERPRFCYHYTFDGVLQTVPPTIRVRRGEHLALRIVNEISGASKAESLPSTALPKCLPSSVAMTEAPVTNYVGYLNHRLEDRYMEVKPVDTNIHLHGFQGPAYQENVFLSTLSTAAHGCEYHITIPPTQPPGTYFYHPHVHGASHHQVAHGLSGVWIVEPDTPALARSDEHVLILRYRVPFVDDNHFAPDPNMIFVTGARRLAERKAAAPAAYDPFNPPPWPLEHPMRAAGISLDPSGCDGLPAERLVAIDGYDTPVSIDVPAGNPQLLRILNATTDSPKLLQLREPEGRSVPLHVVELDGTPIGGDDAHPLSRYIAIDQLMLPPASRADIMVTAASGQTLTLTAGHFCAGIAGFFQQTRELAHIHASAPQSGGLLTTVESSPLAGNQDNPAVALWEYARANPKLVRRRAITFTEYEIPQHGKVTEHPAYYITDTTKPDFHEHPYWPVYDRGATVPSNPDIVVKAGAIEEWYLFNTTTENHAFHIHQMSFVAEHGPAGSPATVDTMFVPIGTLLPNPKEPNYPLVKPTLRKALLDFRHVAPGTFVFHCHMLFDEDAGMMGIIRVE